ncbi:MAG: helix-turn-helix domain-containing protein [Alphaproteobacteria bacterium]
MSDFVDDHFVQAAICGVFSPALPVSAFKMKVLRDAEVYGEQEKAEFLYKVVSGAVRTYTISEDGRRQIDAFHLPGDVFGFETGPLHRFSAEAIADSEIIAASRSAIERAAEQDGAAARELWAMTARQLARVCDHMLMLGRKGAAERVVSFLLEMSARDQQSKDVTLPMSRTDIADYLGLTIETVSRCFSQLGRSHAIELNGARKVKLRDVRALEAMAA